MDEYKQYIRNYIRHEIKTLQNLDINEIEKAMQVLKAAYDRESTVYVFGNGGSSATASHWYNDFNKGLSELLEKKFNFVCLNDNIPTLMAIANDIGFEEVFRMQLMGRLKKGDIILAISGSGNSPNVINAVEYAKEQGCEIIGVTGYDGGKLDKLADYHLHAHVQSMQITEDIHMFFDHMIMSIFYKTMCGIDSIVVV